MPGGGGSTGSTEAGTGAGAGGVGAGGAGGVAGAELGAELGAEAGAEAGASPLTPLQYDQPWLLESQPWVGHVGSFSIQQTPEPVS